MMDYAVITPARDERFNLGRLAQSLVTQTILPRVWVIVDSGSSDGTNKIASDLAGQFAWVTVLTLPGEQKAVRGAPIVRSLNAGLAALVQPLPAVVVKLDADVSFHPDHFESLLRAFAARPRLGIASGSCIDDAIGSQERFVTGDHVWGAVRAYRRECLADVAPLEERMGWDTVDEVKARLAGWETGLVPGVTFFHHRLEGLRDGSRRRAWRTQGETAHFLGYRPSYLFAKTLFRLAGEPAAVAILEGYVRSALGGRERVSDRRVTEALRREQRLRELHQRAREALGRRVRSTTEA
jgi:biofilm PGA synthesis N-glycosyltransferase PgaC